MLDLVFCIFGCDTIPKYKEQILKVQETWGGKAMEYSSVKVLFFLGEETTELVGDCFIHLPGVQNDYLSASYKQFLGLQYVQHHFPCRFVFVCGTDTYVNVPLLLQFSFNFNHEKPLYIGGHGLTRTVKGKELYFHNGGGGVLLSHACQNRLQTIFPVANDIWQSICENEPDYLKPVCDIALAYFIEQEIGQSAVFYTPKLAHFIDKTFGTGAAKLCTPKYLFLTCNYNGKYGPNLESTCCPVNSTHWPSILSCHLMSLQNFDDFTRILETNHWFVLEDKSIQDNVYCYNDAIDL